MLDLSRRHQHALARPPAGAAAGETTTDSGFQVGLPVSTPAGLLNLSILRSDIALDLELSALEEEGRGEVISNPRLVTTNQREAVIKQGRWRNRQPPLRHIQ